MDLDEGSTKCQRATESVLIDRASPVFSADEDVHNPSVGGLGTSWGRRLERERGFCTERSCWTGRTGRSCWTDWSNQSNQNNRSNRRDWDYRTGRTVLTSRTGLTERSCWTGRTGRSCWTDWSNQSNRNNRSNRRD